ISARVEQLGPALRRLLELASLLGASVARNDLIAVGGEGARSDGYLDALVDRGLLRADALVPGAMSFTHPLVRDEVSRRIDRTRRLDMHRRIVETFDARQSSMAMRTETLAWHCENAGMPERAIEAWLRAGSAAAEEGAHSTA